ncbi:glycosyltransferase family 2 protein [Riemerella anatipestifer]|uniref:glycosyltransferase family 2 protein n=1 Tax=Riemerella anatipestifer TaxID=34085 RepID=UPI00129E81EB|nr:glycosyltransferase family 2 protein [Riemerella anatipestifer]MBT0549775.1 glycosyltransferase family 2 protein [Riemerella anatipestifer]MBT0556016.1 glycosyltransferase family 2 protein [Riemerella anatipestifer]MBT0560538.1 glycosyltransferase family 2 protein [Riemerella anatipestifer]MCO7354552.1 glycosyltransferase family 2 protein [Riemerella anatipestifer]MDY3524151.1 glycosyltransferase family 2 protein [Riemerella anatipestifer]
MISIVSPVYRAEKILPTLVAEIHRVMQKIAEPYEIILVDDRSPDNSWEVMKALSAESENLKVYRLSRNFGQHATIFAGLSRVSGDWVVVMDCDMQDQPKEIEKLYKKAKEGYKIVTARRRQRKDKLLKILSSNIFYRLFNYLSGMKINREVANFGIYHREVIEAVKSIGDYIKFFPLFINFVGYTTASIEVEHSKRGEGKSSYNFRKLVSLAFNVIFSFSDKPLRLFVTFGGLVSLLSLLMGLWYLYKFAMGYIVEPGFTSLILSIWFLSGVLISCIGVLGIYLGKAYNQMKNRPVYIIEEHYES